jgi:hypothetical protein
VASPPHNACNRNFNDPGITAAKLHLIRVASMKLAYRPHIIALLTTDSPHEHTFTTKCTCHTPYPPSHRGFAVLMCSVRISDIEASVGLHLL